MDLRLTPVSMPTSIRPNTGVRPAGAGGSQEVATGGFPDAFKNALQSVSKAQNESSRLQREVQMENPKVSLEETMIAIQKAQIGFQATLNVRNRMVQAYTDIMNMQV
jgi:flagellar hook-basal body complex protein FliE